MLLNNLIWLRILFECKKFKLKARRQRDNLNGIIENIRRLERNTKKEHD